MKVKISKKSVVDVHFVTDFLDTVKSVATDSNYPQKCEFKGDSHVANCDNGIITVKRSKLTSVSASFQNGINSQLNLDQYSSGSKDPSNDDLKNNAMFDDKQLNSAIDSELEVNVSRAQDIKREEQFLGTDSGSEENVDNDSKNSNYTSVNDLDSSKLSDIVTRGKNMGIEIEISDIQDTTPVAEDDENKKEKKDDEEKGNDSYE